jgi:putative ABC transport system permease protein
VLDNGGGPESVSVLPVTTEFFPLLGRPPALGREFSLADGRDRVAILSDGAWRRLFSGDPNVVGRTVTLDGEAYAIVGVTAGAHLEFRSDPDIFVSIDAAAPAMQDRARRTLEVYGRVEHGATMAQAEAELRTVAARIAAAFPAGHEGEVLHVFDLQERHTGYNWRQLYFFLGGAVLVMVLSCLNVANLLLARALRRQREFAIRGALGGGTGALVRQLLVEGAVLAVPGALAGTLGAMWLVRVFTATVPADLLQRGGDSGLDGRVALFAIGLTIAITVALALSPLVFARRLDLNVMLAHGGRTAGRSPRQRAVRAGLLVAQVTATLVLLAGAWLFVLSFVRLIQAPLGFDPHDRVLMRLSLPAARYADDAAKTAFADRWLAEARAVAGVRDVAVASETPLTPRGVPAARIAVSGRPRPAPGSEPIALFLAVSPRYFATLDIPLLDGRAFDVHDVAGAPRVVVVNDLFARRFFPGERAVGRTVELIPHHVGSPWTNRPGLVTIVGVVGNVRNFSINEVDFSNVYLPFAQAPAPSLDLVAATAIPAGNAVDPLRRAARRVDSGLALTSLTLGSQRVSDSLQGARLNLTLIVVFAALAVVLAAVGIYGSMACAVEERTREFGVRMALGAMPRTILADALRGSVRVGVIGCAVGTAVVVALARVLGDALYLVPGQHGGMLYQVSTTNPVALAGACGALLAVAILAGLVPARRATRTDPLLVLRQD